MLGATDSSPPESRVGRSVRAFCYAIGAEPEKAVELLEEEERLPEAPQVAWTIALAYGALGDLDPAFRWLTKAVESHALELKWFRYSALLEPMRNDPRFGEILRKMNLD